MFAAVNGLRVHGDLDPVPGFERVASGARPLTFGHYETVREWVLRASSTTGCTVQRVKRALYQLASPVKAVKDRPWSAYAKALVQQLP